MWRCVLLGLFCSLQKMSHASDSISVQIAYTKIQGKVGSSLVLPCWLSPQQDAVNLEVRWYRTDKFSTPALFYRNQKIVMEQQDENYINRTFLTQRDAQSPGLKGGDVSLRLENLTVDDEGAFYCYVSGAKSYDSKSMDLSVTVLGSSPVLSMQPQDDLVNVSCSSCGWRPQPTLKWKSNSTKTFQPASLAYSKGKDQHICVHSWVLISSSESHLASCSLSLSDGEERESTVDIRVFAHLVDAEDTAGAWKVLFALALLAALALIGVAVFFYRKYKTGYIKAKPDEENLQTVSSNINMEDLRKCAVSITLDTSKAHPDLSVNTERGIVRDKQDTKHPREPGFPYYLSICGINRFSSGRSYWEVKLTSPNIQPKESWLIGVTKASNFFSHNKNDLTPSKGFWFLCSDGPNGLHVNTEPEISLPVVRPEIVGVLLDLDKGELSFYNTRECLHLVTLKTKFPKDLVPLFNPGIGDGAPLTLNPCTQVNQKEPAENNSTYANVSEQTQQSG